MDNPILQSLWSRKSCRRKVFRVSDAKNPSLCYLRYAIAGRLFQQVEL